MNSYDLRNLQEAYMDVYQLDEKWRPVNIQRVRSRMGKLEQGIEIRPGETSPEDARYQRVRDVTLQSSRNPNKPFQKPTYDPGGLRRTSGGGWTGAPEVNPQWKPFSSRLPKAQSSNQGKIISQQSSQSKQQISTPPSFTNRLTTHSSRSGGLMDKQGDYASDLRKRGTTSSGRGGGGSSAQGLGSGPSGITGRYQVGGSRGYGISGIRLADAYEYDIYDIILSHLLDEGYAETIESAEVIMTNMSEEWIESIIEKTQLNEISIGMKRRAADASVSKVKKAQDDFDNLRTSDTAGYLGDILNRATTQHRRLAAAAYPTPQRRRARTLKSTKSNLEKVFNK